MYDDRNLVQVLRNSPKKIISICLLMTLASPSCFAISLEEKRSSLVFIEEIEKYVIRNQLRASSFMEVVDFLAVPETLEECHRSDSLSELGKNSFTTSLVAVKTEEKISQISLPFESSEERERSYIKTTLLNWIIPKREKELTDSEIIQIKALISIGEFAKKNISNNHDEVTAEALQESFTEWKRDLQPTFTESIEKFIHPLTELGIAHHPFSMCNIL